MGILILGIIPGMVALRNSIIASMATIGNILTTVIPSFTFSGFAIIGTPGGTIARVQGFQVNQNSTNQLTADQIAPVIITGLVVIPPAP